jgi:uncharacterized integral membrane protein
MRVKRHGWNIQSRPFKGHVCFQEAEHEGSPSVGCWTDDQWPSEIWWWLDFTLFFCACKQLASFSYNKFEYIWDRLRPRRRHEHSKGIWLLSGHMWRFKVQSRKVQGWPIRKIVDTHYTRMHFSLMVIFFLFLLLFFVCIIFYSYGVKLVFSMAIMSVPNILSQVYYLDNLECDIARLDGTPR